METMGSLFSGVGGWEFAARGYLRPVWALEFIPEIAHVYAQNHGHEPIIANIRDVDAMGLEPVDVLVASPPCPAFSKARKTSSTRSADAAAGLEILRFVEDLRPTRVVIENAPAYLGSDVAEELIETLRDFGFNVDARVLDAADYGCPQRRKRTIIRADMRGAPRPPLKLPEASWLDAIADLTPDLPEASLANWQRENIERVPPKSYPVFVVGGNPPEFANADGYRRVWVSATEPAPTLAKSASSGGTKIMLSATDVRQFTVAAAARLSGMPDDIVLPGRSAALNILGNTIPPPLAAAALGI